MTKRMQLKNNAKILNIHTQIWFDFCLNSEGYFLEGFHPRVFCICSTPSQRQVWEHDKSCIYCPLWVCQYSHLVIYQVWEHDKSCIYCQLWVCQYSHLVIYQVWEHDKSCIYCQLWVCQYSHLVIYPGSTKAYLCLLHALHTHLLLSGSGEWRESEVPALAVDLRAWSFSSALLFHIYVQLGLWIVQPWEMLALVAWGPSIYRLDSL